MTQSAPPSQPLNSASTFPPKRAITIIVILTAINLILLSYLPAQHFGTFMLYSQWAIILIIYGLSIWFYHRTYHHTQSLPPLTLIHVPFVYFVLWYYLS